ncbi:MAG: YwaF family protein [Defluviitaleaceae bacterium]|nr:YwaF family protein [Defluviitaleaceae bacterium]
MIQRYGFFAYFSDRPDAGYGFGMYSVTHFVVLAVIAVIIAAMCIGYKRMDDASRLKMVRIIAYTLVVIEIMQVSSYPIFHDGFRVEYFSLHLCGIMIFVGLAYAIKPSETVGEILYAVGLPGYLAAFAFPNWTMYPLLNFYAIKAFTTHGLQIAFILMLIFAGQVRPSPSRAWKPLVFLVAIAIPIYILNLAIGTNFLYINSGSPGSPLEIFIDTFGSPLFLVPYAGLVVVVIALMYMPWYIIEKKKGRAKY